MEDIVKELRHLISHYLSNDARLSRQKLCVVAQSEPRFILMEGLKLLSLCIEVDSCEANDCEHNTDNKSVEMFLFERGVLCPGLPYIIPDGFKLMGNTLIILECFVRANPADFQQKYEEDSVKLNLLKSDLHAIGITLLPLIDGRTCYNNTFMPEWVCDRVKHLLFEALKYQQENNALFEESEYLRLCESLSSSSPKLSGIESLSILTDKRSSHFDKILEKCYQSIDADMRPLEIRQKISSLYQSFRNRVKKGSVAQIFKRVSKADLLSDLQNLYSGIVIQDQDDVSDLMNSFPTLSPITTFCYFQPSEQTDSDKTLDAAKEVSSLRSMFNKVKSLKVLNTRRKLLLLLDLIILLKHVALKKLHGIEKVDGEWLGSSFLSVNDRLVSLLATQRDTKKWLCRRLKLKTYSDQREMMSAINEECRSIINRTIKKCETVLKDVGLSFSVYSVDMGFIDEIDFQDCMDYSVRGVIPTISYTKQENFDIKCKVTKFDVNNDTDFQMLSSLSLGIVNSMKTSSTVKIRQNEVGVNRYKIVKCSESYYQDLKTVRGQFKLLYQKTGEVSKCYAVNDMNIGEICSFYADPKRYFVPIFSHSVLTEMIDVMMSWLKDCVELQEELGDIKSLLKMIVFLILAHPSKRSQRFLQGMRYFIMAFVSEYHHVDLISKLKEPLITETEFFLFRLVRCLFNKLLNENVQTLLNNRFKFILNVSYLCHFITKETPDRLTDQIKCFEKFVEPKVENGMLHINPKENMTSEEQDDFLDGMDRLLIKGEKLDLKTPGVSCEVFSLMASSYNSGLLLTDSEVKRGIKDPSSLAGCATALDLASNKSVVINKYKDQERVLHYDMNRLTAVAVCQLTDTFKRKGKYLLNSEDYDYKVQQVISNLVLGKVGEDNTELLEEVSQSNDFIEGLTTQVTNVLNNYREKPAGNLRENMGGSEGKSLKDLTLLIDGDLDKRLIIGELSVHLVEDFDRSLFSEEWYKATCERAYKHALLRGRYFYESEDGTCPIEKMSQAVASRTYYSNDYFSCFKSLLIQMNADMLTGRFNHYKSSVAFNFNFNRLLDDTRISERESNSQALSEALSLTKCTSSALKNLCFYSQESPQSYTSMGPDTGRLKFSLSYKEQVGGNRELYIGDLRTKMFTRLIEDYFESYTNQLKGSCLNNEKEFENAILSMKLNVSLGHMCYSMDHSKWGPMMCPFLFLMLYRNLRNPTCKDDTSPIEKDHISTLLSWHIHKIVEVPFNVVAAMMKSFLKRKLALMKDTTQTLTETLFFQEFERGVVPSHMSSILDMGQGILHNTSDFYGLITERFINFCVKCIYSGSVDSYTSSDDQISLFDLQLTEVFDKDPEEFHILLEFHNYLSDSLNKFVSPKSVIGKYVAEFKSRFFVWGDEVPLLTKFVAAALHNIKCKEPHQLAETIDTIIDQSVANGVPIKLCNKIQKRVISILEYAQFPIDPFLLFCESDVRDWVDGNRGYRIMRNIESIMPAGTERVRSVLRVLFNKLKAGDLHEEFTTAYFSQNKYDSIVGLFDMLGLTPPSEEDLNVFWLNLSAHHPIRMVLRQKIVYPLCVEPDAEKIPTIVKTLQNKLSSNFTRGAQKLLSESVNRSAFQSGIASGFVGLCKTLGSKCVRDADKAVHYIKGLLKSLKETTSLYDTNEKGITLWHSTHKLHSDNMMWPQTLLRPVLWDYMCIALSTALEIGPWVLGEPKNKPPMRALKWGPCDYFPLKPHNTKILEDRVGLNHIIYSIRRLYPNIFEKHLLPYMSDLASKKMKWSPRIKFLDLCVTLDVNCEALSLISHVVKWKREEQYVVLSQELAHSHERSHTPLTEERVVSTADVASNFLKQLYFESYVRPLVATSRTLGSFTWFPHKSTLPLSEGLERLGPFASFVEKVIYKGIERPMYKFDIFSGFSWVDYEIECALLNINQLIMAGINFQLIKSEQDFLDEVAKLRVGNLKILKTVRFTIRNQGDSTPNKFSLTLHFSGSLNRNHHYVPTDVSVTFSGDVDRTMIHNCWEVAKRDDEFSEGKSPVWTLSLDQVSDLLEGDFSLSPYLLLDVDLKGVGLTFDENDMERIGPEWECVPLVVRDGALWEGNQRVKAIIPDLLTQDVDVFVAELTPDHLEVLTTSLRKIISDRVKLGVHLRSCDLVTTLKKRLPNNWSNLLDSVLSSTEGWVEFEGYSLCFSKSLGGTMRHTANGKYRLKGRLCERVSLEPRQAPVEIE
nr:RNA-dependent RNA polymerase [Mammarenavirus marientalense]